MRRSKPRQAQPRAGPDTGAPKGPPAPTRPGWPPGAPHRPKWPAVPPRRPAGADGQPFLRSEPFFSGRRAESRRRRGRRPASRRPSGAGGRVGTPAGRGDRWAAVGGPYGFVYTSLSTILELSRSGYLAEKSYCRSILALVTRMVEISEALFFLKKVLVLLILLLIGNSISLILLI